MCRQCELVRGWHTSEFSFNLILTLCKCEIGCDILESCCSMCVCWSQLRERQKFKWIRPHFICMLCRQRNGRLYCRLSGEYTGSACLPECEAWLHEKLAARIGAAWGRRLVQNIRWRGTCDNAWHNALAKSSYARIFSSAEFRAVTTWRYVGRCY